MAKKPAPALQSAEALEAKHGEKMIEVKLRFWTNGLADEDGKVTPKHAWSAGVVRLERNGTHNIVPQRRSRSIRS